MTDFANLVVKIDSSEVKQGTADLDKLTAAGKRTQAATDAQGKTWVKASSEAGRLRLEEIALRMESERLEKAQRKVGQSATEMAREAQRSAAGLGKATASAGAMRAGATQLSYQLSDVATQFALGARPMQIFAAQGTQVVGALSLMRGSAGGLIGFLAGPWGIGIAAAVTALSPFIARLFDTESAADKATDALQRLIDKAAEERASRIEGALADQGANRSRDRLSQIELELATPYKRRFATDIAGELADQRRRNRLEQEALGIRQRLLVVDGELAAAAYKKANADKDSEKATKSSTAATKAKTIAVNEQAKALDNLLDRLLKPERDRAQRNGEFEMLAREIAKAEAAGEKALPTLLELERALEALRGEGIDQSKKKLGFEDPGSLVAKVLPESNELVENRVREMRELARATEDANGQLQEMIYLLGNIGGVGSAIGGALGIFTGNTRAIRGPIGDILNIGTGVSKITDSKGDVHYIARTIGDEISAVFDKDSNFFKNMSLLLKGAGTGLIAGNAFGFNSTGGQIGSAIGGALGQKFGEKLLSAGLNKVFSGLGSAAGPIGAIAGSLLGGALGSIFGKTPKASVTIGNAGGSLGITGTRSNSSSRLAAAQKSAGAIIESLDSLAAELGGTVDPSRGSVSIGIRKGKYRVDPTGAGRTKAKNGVVDFGSDAEAAALFAMQNLIKDGVLVGLRKGTERLLKNADDLERGVQKALAFEGVFRELKAFQDPLGAALADLDKQMTHLREIFKEAGATTEEYAQLEELFAMKRKDAIEQSTAELKDFLDALNFGSGSPLAARQKLANAGAVLKPFEDAINAGKIVDQSAFTDAAQTYLDLSRQINASDGSFFADFDRIRALTQQAIDNVQATADLDKYAQQTAQNTADMANILSDQTALLQAVNDNLASIRLGFSSGTLGWLSQSRAYIA